MPNRIVRVSIIDDGSWPPWVALGGGLMQVSATFEDESTEILFSFYPDELSFTEDEFVGLTRDDALKLHFDRDMEWLRSP